MIILNLYISSVILAIVMAIPYFIRGRMVMKKHDIRNTDTLGAYIFVLIECLIPAWNLCLGYAFFRGIMMTEEQLIEDIIYEEEGE